jgi:ParB family chromosome partitioning protein
MSDEEIAAAFFVTPAVVKQRLKLVAVSPKLLDLYAEDAMTLDQLMAFTVSNDHARQEQVWEALQRGYNKEPYLIRRMLTEGKVSASERRAVFVGAEAYEAAGGTIARDLFQQDHGGWFEDVALLDRLVDEKLQAIASEVAEGWKWVEVQRDFAYGHTQGLRRLPATQDPLTDQEQAELEALYAEHEQIEAEHADSPDDLPDEVDRRLAEIEQAIARLEERPAIYEPEDIGRAGAFVSLSHEGRVRIERGFVRPEDEPRMTADDPSEGVPVDEQLGSQGNVQRAVITIGGTPQPDGADSSDEEDEGDAIRPLSERLVTELTAHRTLALRAALAEDPDIAVVAVLHALCLRTFYGQQAYDPASCLEIEAKSASLAQGGPDLNGTPAAQALAQLHEQWRAQLPGQPAELWDWLIALDGDSRMSLFAYCAARTVNAIHETWNRRARAMAHATRLAQALRLDMAAQWSPTKENFLGRVTKAHILQAVREAKGEAAAQLIDHLKKGDMAEEAERLLAGTGWLPAILRTPAGTAAAAAEDDASHGADLPAFLAGDDDDSAAEIDSSMRPHAIAAE